MNYLDDGIVTFDKWDRKTIQAISNQVGKYIKEEFRALHDKMNIREGGVLWSQPIAIHSFNGREMHLRGVSYPNRYRFDAIFDENSEKFANITFQLPYRLERKSQLRRMVHGTS